METFAKNPDAPAQVSPELVLVSPPEEARAAREALEEPHPPTQAPVSNLAPRAEVLRRVIPVEAPVVAAPRPEPRPATFAPPPTPAPAAPVRRRRSRLLLLAFALLLAAGGFVVGRELTMRHDNSGAAAARPSSAAGAPNTPRPASQPGATSALSQNSQNGGPRTRSTSSAGVSQRPPTRTAPAVSWKARPGVRHYRLDLVSGGAVVLTILTDEPRAKIPLTFPNAGRNTRLVPGTYLWRVRAATARPSRVLAHGTVKVR